VVEDWLSKARRAIPQYERDARRQDGMFQRMVAFARVHGERLATLRQADVLQYLEKLTRRGEKEWQVMQALDAICLLLSFGCGRLNVRIPEVREHWLVHRQSLVPGGTAARENAHEFESPLPPPTETILERLSRRISLPPRSWCRGGAGWVAEGLAEKLVGFTVQFAAGADDRGTRLLGPPAGLR
jgi:hypothetical protein